MADQDPAPKATTEPEKPAAEPEVEPDAAIKPPKPDSPEEGYYKRHFETLQAEHAKLEEQVKAHEREKMTELEREKAEKAEAQAKAELLQGQLARQEAIIESGLPPELARLVPKDVRSADEAKAFIVENIQPIRAKLEETQRAGSVTSPAAGQQQTTAGSYDKWAEMKRTDPQAALEYYTTNRKAIIEDAKAGRKLG
ncbi:MAG: hypothetical protein A2V88_17650 [Elusimicrobia bacterium RBG_16_66_12]|nr:MAG: hypothetical protein A2V88_17650 [Elusimicrobia bacterium RBG_16_66_12]